MKIHGQITKTLEQVCATRKEVWVISIGDLKKKTQEKQVIRQRQPLIVYTNLGGEKSLGSLKARQP